MTSREWRCASLSLFLFISTGFQDFFFQTDGVTMDARWILSFLLIILTKTCNPGVAYQKEQGKRDVAAHECTSSESVACRQEIQDLREDRGRYYYASDDQALDELCRKQVLAVDCVNSFARECLSQKEQAYFKTLVLGSDKFLDTFCFEDSDLRKRYLQHSSCIRNITTKLDYCTQHYRNKQEELDASETNTKILLEKTCCIYFENIQCSSTATQTACGKDAAQLVSDLWTLLSGTYLTESCKPFSKYDPESCTLMSSSIRFVPNTSLWTFIFIFYVFCQLLKY